MKISNKEVYDYLKSFDDRIHSKVDDLEKKVITMNATLTYFRNIFNDKKLDFRYHFSLLWSAVGIIIIALVGFAFKSFG